MHQAKVVRRCRDADNKCKTSAAFRVRERETDGRIGSVRLSGAQQERKASHKTSRVVS